MLYSLVCFIFHIDIKHWLVIFRLTKSNALNLNRTQCKQTEMMSMFNPAIVGSTGGKLRKIKRNKAIVKYSADNRDGEIMINVDKKYLVIINGSNVDKEDLMNYAKAVDYKGLKSF